MAVELLYDFMMRQTVSQTVWVIYLRHLHCAKAVEISHKIRVEWNSFVIFQTTSGSFVFGAGLSAVCPRPCQGSQHAKQVSISFKIWTLTVSSLSITLIAANWRRRSWTWQEMGEWKREGEPASQMSA